MSNLQTRPDLLKALKDAAAKPASAAELREQRISFIMGSLDRKSGVTRDRVIKVLDDQQGK